MANYGVASTIAVLFNGRKDGLTQIGTVIIEHSVGPGILQGEDVDSTSQDGVTSN